MAFRLSPSLEAAISVVIMALAALIALISALSFMALPFLMWMVGGDTGEGGYWAMPWALLVVAAIFFNLTRVVHVFQECRLADFGKMCAATLIPVATFPGWY